MSVEVEVTSYYHKTSGHWLISRGVALLGKVAFMIFMSVSETFHFSETPEALHEPLECCSTAINNNYWETLFQGRPSPSVWEGIKHITFMSFKYALPNFPTETKVNINRHGRLLSSLSILFFL